MESPPLKTSPPAGRSVAISFFISSISLTASISRPILTSPQPSLPALTHASALPRLKPGARSRLAIFSSSFFRILPGMVRIPRYSSLSAGLPFILSYPRRRNRLPASTGGAEVTGAGPKASDVSGFKDGDTASSATSTNEGEVEKYQIRMATRKQCRGSFAEGPRHPGLSCPPPQ